MWSAILTSIELTAGEFSYCLAAIFVAGVVRGFSGFALSALTMASVAVILPPIQLIPICFLLETTASLMMLRGGLAAARMRLVWILSLGSVIGVPLGLLATQALPVETSRLVALAVILVLALAQLSSQAPALLAGQRGLYAAGVLSGVATGLASVGGMVVALYVLSQQIPAKVMRASLVMYLFIGTAVSLVFQLSFGILNLLALQRALVFAPAVLLGVMLGSLLFHPDREMLYRRVCLLLLVSLAALGLLRVLV